MKVPNLTDAVSCLSQLIILLKYNRNLYIHCWGGRGRAGTIGGLLLGCLYPELSIKQVLNLVQTRYETRDVYEDINIPKLQSPETDEQALFINEFISELRK